MACAIRAVFQLKNLRRGPGKSGLLKRFTDSDGCTASSRYLNSKQIITPFPTSLTLQVRLLPASSPTTINRVTAVRFVNMIKCCLNQKLWDCRCAQALVFFPVYFLFPDEVNQFNMNNGKPNSKPQICSSSITQPTKLNAQC
jgi:hypothetical protein